MENTANPNRFWDIAGITNTSDPLALINFYYFNGATGRDHMTITGEGHVGIGDTSPDAELEVNRYTKLGNEGDSPAIKTKKITAFSDGSGTQDIPHGLANAMDKILSIYATGSILFMGLPIAREPLTVNRYDPNDIQLDTSGFPQPGHSIVIFIVYEE